jgi:DNA-binding transcriptional ArsR family regulator
MSFISFWNEMSAGPNIARLASLVSEPARAAMLQHLLDGRSWTATELAKIAAIRAPAASAHLKKLLECELITVSPKGRHRYFRLAGAHIAKLIEQMQCFAPVAPSVTPGQRRAATALITCRLCYDHLAGRVGVSITEAMLHRSWLTEEEPWLRLTDLGIQELSSYGIPPALGRTCTDWSERKLHVAGDLGATLAQFLLQKSLVVRDSKSRALRVTPQGREALRDIFGISA